MTAETPSTSATPEPAKKRNLVPILIVVGVIVLVIIGVGVWRLTSDDSSSPTVSGEAPPKLAKTLYTTWQGQDEAAAGNVATADAVSALFAIPIAQGTGLVFGGCQKTGDAPLPKTCTFSRPGGELKMTVSTVGDTRTITAVTLGPAATTPTG